MLGGYPTTGKALPDTTHLQFLHIGWLIHHLSIPCAKAGLIQNVYTLHPKFATCNKREPAPAVFSPHFSMVFCLFFCGYFGYHNGKNSHSYRTVRWFHRCRNWSKKALSSLHSQPGSVRQTGWPVGLEKHENTLEWLWFQKFKRNLFVFQI